MQRKFERVTDVIMSTRKAMGLHCLSYIYVFLNLKDVAYICTLFL